MIGRLARTTTFDGVGPMMNRICLLVTALAGGAVVASCSSDNLMVSGGSKALEQFFDSAYVADSAAGLFESPKTIVEGEAAFLADKGLQPTSVTVETDAGALSMQMMAGTDVDIAGTIADSESITVGWTADYGTWLIFFTGQFTGNASAATIKSHRNRSLASLMASMPGRAHRGVRAEVDIDSLGGNWLGVLWDHGITTFADSASGMISWFGEGGHCTWQGVTLARFEADSAISCVPVSYDIGLSLHDGGPNPSLVHVSIAPQPIPGLRLMGFDF
jgi:hypothetical protein